MNGNRVVCEFINKVAIEPPSSTRSGKTLPRGAVNTSLPLRALIAGNGLNSDCELNDYIQFTITSCRIYSRQ